MDANAHDAHGYTALQIAAMQGHTKTIKALLASKAVDVSTHSILLQILLLSVTPVTLCTATGESRQAQIPAHDVSLVPGSTADA